MINNEFYSDLKEVIEDYLEEMKATGFSTEVPRRYLQHFDAFYAQNGYIGKRLTKVMVEAFVYGIDYEKNGTKYKKEIIMSNLATYMQRIGLEAYICPRKSQPKFRGHISHIFSRDELQCFFNAIDQYDTITDSYRVMIDSVLFRLLYASGMRIGEALKLKRKDIDFTNQTIFIKQAKNNKDRMIPVIPSVIQRMQELDKKIHGNSSKEDIFFKSTYSNNNGIYDKTTIYRRFRTYLLLADIPHIGNGPRVHDFRHTFAVHSLKKLILEGETLLNIMPYLAAYLGHTDFRGTQYYLKLTSDLYPHIISETEELYGYMIPEVGDANEE